MDKFEKFQRRIDAALRARIEAAVSKIVLNEMKGLDIKPLTGQDDIFRCRVGKVRIIFRRTNRGNMLLDIGFRERIYKRKH